MKKKFYNFATKKIDYREADTLVTTRWISASADSYLSDVREATSEEKMRYSPLLNEYGEYHEINDGCQRMWQMR